MNGINIKFLQGLLAAVILLLLNACGGSQSTGPTTPHGYSYVHHVKNEGQKAAPGFRVTYHETAFKNGEKWYSTHDFPAPRTLVMPEESNMPKPIHPSYSALLTMSKGDSVTVYPPTDSLVKLYSQLEPGTEVILHIKLLDIVDPEAIEAELNEFRAKARLQDYLDEVLGEELITTESGLKYIIHEKGDGPAAEKGKSIKVHYAGFLRDGTSFDNSFQKGNPFDFPLGQGAVIKGWDEGLSYLNVGDKATLFVPFELGYGAAGRKPNIPAKAELIFYIEFVSMQ